jgi:protein transport protein YIF1
MNDSILRFVLVLPDHNDTVLMIHLQILGESASRATAVIFFDFCFVKLGCYILNIQGSSQVIDIVAYGGYKFVGCIHLYLFNEMMVTYDPNLISSVILSLAAGFLGATGILWTLIFVYAFLSNAFFLVRLFKHLPSLVFLTFAAQLRSLRSVVLPDTSSVPPTHAIAKISSAQRRRRIIFLFLEAVTQILYMTWLVRI